MNGMQKRNILISSLLLTFCSMMQAQDAYAPVLETVEQRSTLLQASGAVREALTAEARTGLTPSNPEIEAGYLFGQPETGLGIIPGFGGTQRLARLVGSSMAKQLIFTARNIKSDEALRIGLVNAVYPLDELYAAAEKMANTIAANAPIAVRAAKKAMNAGISLAIGEAVVCEEKAFCTCFETKDQQEGMGAFLEKRKHEPFTNC